MSKAIGMKRLIGAITAFGALPYGLVKGVQAINGVSDEEAEFEAKIRNYLSLEPRLKLM